MLPHGGCVPDTQPTQDAVESDLDEMLVHLTWRLTLDQALDTVAVDLFERALPQGIGGAPAAMETTG